METIKCSYCECKVRMAEVEANDGVCPECGAPLMGSLLFEKEDADQDEDEFEEESTEELDLDAEEDE